MNETERPTIKSLIEAGTFIVAPGVYDGVSALIVNQFSFHAAYMTGYGATASHLGLPDAGLATYTDMVGRAGTLAKLCRMPLIADADTGYGGLLNVRHTVRGYEAAGVQAIQLEDQEMPKKCGHTPGRRVIPAEEMVLKIKVAAEARNSPDFLIVARIGGMVQGAFGDAAFQDRLRALGVERDVRPAPALLEAMQRDDRIWAAAAQAGHIRPQ